jgi:hypothetical protein
MTDAKRGTSPAATDAAAPVLRGDDADADAYVIDDNGDCEITFENLGVETGAPASATARAF